MYLLCNDPDPIRLKYNLHQITFLLMRNFSFFYMFLMVYLWYILYLLVNGNIVTLSAPSNMGDGAGSV